MKWRNSFIKSIYPETNIGHIVLRRFAAHSFHALVTSDSCPITPQEPLPLAWHRPFDPHPLSTALRALETAREIGEPIVVSHDRAITAGCSTATAPAAAAARYHVRPLRDQGAARRPPFAPLCRPGRRTATMCTESDMYRVARRMIHQLGNLAARKTADMVRELGGIGNQTGAMWAKSWPRSRNCSGGVQCERSVIGARPHGCPALKPARGGRHEL
jgi:hypothetical protein